MFGKVLGIFGRSKSKRPATQRAGRAEVAPQSSSPQEAVATPERGVSAAPVAVTAEELCGLRDGMTNEELRLHLAHLYRRHNRAASSLNPELRSYAERMLDAIVEVRHRYLEGRE